MSGALLASAILSLTFAGASAFALPLPTSLPEALLRASWVGVGGALAWRLGVRARGFTHVAPRGPLHLGLPQFLTLSPGEKKRIERAPAGVSDLSPTLFFLLFSLPFALIYIPSPGSVSSDPSTTDASTLWFGASAGVISLLGLMLPSIVESAESFRFVLSSLRQTSFEGVLEGSWEHTVRVAASGRGTGTRRTRWADLEITDGAPSLVNVQGANDTLALHLEGVTWASGRSTQQDEGPGVSAHTRSAQVGDHVLVAGSFQGLEARSTAPGALIAVTVPPNQNPRAWLYTALALNGGVWMGPLAAALFMALSLLRAA